MSEIAERRMRAQIAANESWARTPDRSARTAKARAALMERFVREVDPDGSLPLAERERRAESLRKAHFQRLALKSAQARRRLREASEELAAAEAELRGSADAS